MPSEPSDRGLRLKSSRKESWPFPPHSSFFPRRLQEGNAWFSSSCSQRCTCRAGAIQCRPFACPTGSQCKTDEDGKEICKPYSKGALGGAVWGCPGWGLWGEGAADIDRGGLSPLTSSPIACRFSLGSTFRAKRAKQARESLSAWEREKVEKSSSRGARG